MNENENYEKNGFNEYSLNALNNIIKVYGPSTKLATLELANSGNFHGNEISV